MRFDEASILIASRAQIDWPPFGPDIPSHFIYRKLPNSGRQDSTNKQQVVVTGTWQPVPLEESDRSVQTYSLSQSALLFASPADVFSLDSSVQVQGRAPNGVQGDLSIRGGSFAQTLVLLNGIRLSDAQSAHHNLDLPVPLDAITNIEVLRGSGSTLYGSDAVAGVVNVVTRPVDPETPIEMRLRAAYGSFGTDEESGFLALKQGPVSQQVLVRAGTLARFSRRSRLPESCTRFGNLGQDKARAHPRVLIATRSSLWCGSVLWELQLLGADKDLACHASSGSRVEDVGIVRLSAAHRLIRSSSR